MNDDKYFSDQFVEKAKEKLDSIDFNKLNQDVYNTIDGAISIAKLGLNKYDNFINTLNGKDNKGKYNYPTKNPEVVVQYPKNRTKSSIFTALGSAGLTLNGITAAGVLIAMFSAGSAISPLIATLLFWVAPWSALSYYLFRKGKQIKNKNLRFSRYIKNLSNSTIMLVKDLADSVQKNVDFTKKDLKELIAEDYFHQARLVENDEIFILDNNSFKQYKNYLTDNPNLVSNYREEKVEKDSLQESFLKAHEYLRDISLANSKIKDEKIRENTDDLIKTARTILIRVRSVPEEMPALRKFMDYYLPTIKKMVENYQDFEEKNLQSPEIKNAMLEIEQSIDIIDSAFQKLLNNLFSETAVDVTTDVKVLKNILNQDGLIEEDFTITKEEKHEWRK